MISSTTIQTKPADEKAMIIGAPAVSTSVARLDVISTIGANPSSTGKRGGALGAGLPASDSGDGGLGFAAAGGIGNGSGGRNGGGAGGPTA